MRRKKSVIPGFGLSFGIVMAMLGLIVIIPLCSLVVFSLKLSPQEFWETVTRPRVLANYKVSIMTAFTASAINAVMGLAIAWVLVRYDFPGKRIMDGIIDLPLTISPIIAGLIFVLTFGRQSAIYPLLEKWNLQIIFAVPGVILATIFVTFPFISREIIPVLTAEGTDEEAAALMGANGFQIFTQITFPHIKWAFAMSSILVIMALVILILRNILEYRGRKEGER